LDVLEVFIERLIMPVDGQHVGAVARAKVNAPERAIRESGVRREDRLYDHCLGVVSSISHGHLGGRGAALVGHRIAFDVEPLTILDAQNLVGFSADQQQVARSQNRVAVWQHALAVTDDADDVQLVFAAEIGLGQCPGVERRTGQHDQLGQVILFGTFFRRLPVPALRQQS
jgi:hypothetical protein